MNKFKTLQRLEDPTLVNREAEQMALVNPHYNQKVRLRFINS